MQRTTWCRLVGCAVMASAVGLALLTAGCGSGDEADKEDRPVSSAPRVSRENGETVITLDAGEQARAGLGMVALAAASYQAEVTAYGSVVDLSELADAQGALAQATAHAARAQATLTASRAEFERTRTLHGEQRIVSDKALEAAAATLGADEADASAAQGEVARVTASARQRWGDVIAGWLAAGSPRLDALLRQKERLVELALPGSTLASVPVAVAVRAGAGAPVAARLISPAPQTDPRVQGEAFFYAAPAVSWLPVGSSVAAMLAVGTPRGGVAVPASAVVWWQGKAWIYLESAPGKFVRRAVSTDAPLPGGWFVSGGPVPGDRVVVEGAQLLLSEEGRATLHGSEG